MSKDNEKLQDLKDTVDLLSSIVLPKYLEQLEYEVKIAGVFKDNYKLKDADDYKSPELAKAIENGYAMRRLYTERKIKLIKRIEKILEELKDNG